MRRRRAIEAQIGRRSRSERARRIEISRNNAINPTCRVTSDRVFQHNRPGAVLQGTSTDSRKRPFLVRVPNSSYGFDSHHPLHPFGRRDGARRRETRSVSEPLHRPRIAGPDFGAAGRLGASVAVLRFTRGCLMRGHSTGSSRLKAVLRSGFRKPTLADIVGGALGPGGEPPPDDTLSRQDISLTVSPTQTAIMNSTGSLR